MNYSSLDSSHQDGSNGNKIAFLALLDGELDILKRTCNISSSSDGKMMEFSSLDLSHRADSNGGKFALLALLDGEIFKSISVFILTCYLII